MDAENILSNLVRIGTVSAVDASARKARVMFKDMDGNSDAIRSDRFRQYFVRQLHRLLSGAVLRQSVRRVLELRQQFDRLDAPAEKHRPEQSGHR